MFDADLNKHLGLPDGHQLNKKEAFDLYSYLVGLTGHDCGISPIVLMLYYDKNGDFTREQTRRNSLVNEIFNNMSLEDRFTVKNYLEE